MRDVFTIIAFVWIIIVVPSLLLGLPLWFLLEWCHMGGVVQAAIVSVIGIMAGFVCGRFYADGMDLYFNPSDQIQYVAIGLVNAVASWCVYRAGLKWIEHGRLAASGV